MTSLTLKQWKSGVHAGMKLRCTYRWYWDTPPKDGELCELVEVRVPQAIMRTPTAPRSCMRFPRASELKATEQGFELYFPIDPALSNPNNGPDRSGKLMSRYEYIPEVVQ